MNKKTSIILGVVVLLGVVIGSYFIVNNMINKQEEKLATELYYYAISDFTEIDTATVNNKINNEDTFFLFMGKASCKWSVKLAPIISDIFQGEEIEVFYLDSEDTETNKELQELREFVNVETVPAILYFDNAGGVFNINHDIREKEFSEEYFSNLMSQFIDMEKNK